jgi:carboxymethylenebutenolidase
VHSYRTILAEMVRVSSSNGLHVPAYFARPLGPGPFPGIVLLHHLAGLDEGSVELVRTFAAHGYLTIAPYLHQREVPDTTSENAADIIKSVGGPSDESVVADAAGAIGFLELQATWNGNQGVVGYCSGGRQAYICAASLDFDAAVVCYGGRIVARPEDLTPRRPKAALDMTEDLRCPILGIFGADDQNPSPEQVLRIEQELKLHAKPYEFHSYENAGHAFFDVNRDTYRPIAVKSAWPTIFNFLSSRLS